MSKYILFIFCIIVVGCTGLKTPDGIPYSDYPKIISETDIGEIKEVTIFLNQDLTKIECENMGVYTRSIKSVPIGVKAKIVKYHVILEKTTSNQSPTTVSYITWENESLLYLVE